MKGAVAGLWAVLLAVLGRGRRGNVVAVGAASLKSSAGGPPPGPGAFPRPVVGRWIGRTDAVLEGLLATAEADGSILLLDEADALFAKRSDVKDAHDRYANVEVAFLLRRAEGSSRPHVRVTPTCGVFFDVRTGAVRRREG